MTYEQYLAQLHAKKKDSGIIVGGGMGGGTPRSVPLMSGSIAAPSLGGGGGSGGGYNTPSKPRPKAKPKTTPVAPIDPSTGMPILNQYVDETGDITGGFDKEGYGVIDVDTGRCYGRCGESKSRFWQTYPLCS